MYLSQAGPNTRREVKSTLRRKKTTHKSCKVKERAEIKAHSETNQNDAINNNEDVTISVKDALKYLYTAPVSVFIINTVS